MDTSKRQQFQDLMTAVLKPAELGCPILCENIAYHAANQKLGTNLHHHENKTVLWARFNSGTVKIEEEYTLMDANAIIAATGGSLGLFLGLSCYGVVWKMVEMVETTISSLKGKHNKDPRTMVV